MVSDAARGQRSGVPVIVAAITLILLFLVLFVAAAGFLFWQSYRDAAERGQVQAASAAHVVAANTKWVMETARQALRRIDQTVGDDLTHLAARDVSNLSDDFKALPFAVKTYVVDAAGVTRYSNDPQLKPISITDRDYFAALARGADWYISPLLVSRLNGEQIFVASHRIERNGTFIGAAIVSMPATLFADFWSSLNLGPGSTVSVFRRDGQLVVRYPPAEGPLDLSKYVLFTDYLHKAPEGTYVAPKSPADGMARLVGYRTIEGEDLVALASVSEETVMAPFWANTRTATLLALPAGLALILVSIWIALLLQRDSHRQQALAAALDRNQLLFREIHHRVKNNLQAVSSLIRLQPIPAAAKA